MRRPRGPRPAPGCGGDRRTARDRAAGPGGPGTGPAGRGCGHAGRHRPRVEAARRVCGPAERGGVVRTWQRTLTLPGEALAITRDGRRLVGKSGGAIRVWDVPSGKLIQSLPASREVVCCCISPDGELVAVGGRDDPAPRAKAAA